MKIIRCEKVGQLRLEDTETPALLDNHALLRIKRVGICGTDLHAFKGNQPFFTYPRILGHELAADVSSIASNTQGLQSGDKVVIVPYINCGTCSACEAGKTNCCQQIQVFGVHTDGGMQEMISFPTRLLLPANDLSYEEIAIAEPLAVGAHSLRRAQIKQGDFVVVMGCGPIGMGIIQLAKYLGATVAAVDVNEHRLKQAQLFEADHLINASDAPVEKIKHITHGKLANVVIDATGSKAAIESGITFMRHGGTLVLVGLFKGDLTFHHPSIHAKETTLLCSRNATPEDFAFVMKVLREKRFNTDAYITTRVSFDKIVSGFDAWTAPTSTEIKVMTTWN